MCFHFIPFLLLLFSQSTLCASAPAPRPIQTVASPAPQPAWSGVENVVIRSMSDTNDDFTEEEESIITAPEQQAALAQSVAPQSEEEELEEASPEEVATFLAALQDVFGAFDDEV